MQLNWDLIFPLSSLLSWSSSSSSSLSIQSLKTRKPPGDNKWLPFWGTSRQPQPVQDRQVLQEEQYLQEGDDDDDDDDNVI